ncbi:MAG: PqqD family protein [Candidatus Omnitrophica bacterium]|nr:PqqD family protein [Candidatus Omnitrophota bacterium]
MSTLHRIPARNSDLACGELADETILVCLDPDLGESELVTVLNESASAVWALIDGKRSVEEIIEILLEDYEVSRDELCQDVQDLLMDLCAKNVLNFSEDEKHGEGADGEEEKEGLG